MPVYGPSNYPKRWVAHSATSPFPPTWVTAPTDEERVYVTGNNVSKVFEIDLESWKVIRTFDTGSGPYNLAVTPEGSTLVVTYKKGAAVGFWDLESGRELGRVAT